MRDKINLTGLSIILDGKGGMRELPISEPIQMSESDVCFWQHLDFKDGSTFTILTDAYGFDSTVAEALCDEDIRPRSFASGDGMVLILRGVNLNKGQDEEDMVSLRIWLDGKRIITLSHGHLHTLENLYDTLKMGKGPVNAQGCFVEISQCLAEIISNLAIDISDRADDIEEEVVDERDNRQNFNLRSRLSELRREIITLRRNIAPQKDIFANLLVDKSGLFDPHNKMEIREISNDITKAVEDLDYAKDHLAISHEELQSKVSLDMSRIMYMISIVTVIFMPLTLITGLLGINVHGIPYAESENAFTLVCMMLGAICILLIFIMKRLRWL